MHPPRLSSSSGGVSSSNNPESSNNAQNSYVEPGPSRRIALNGSSGQGQQGLDYDLDALDNFPADPSSVGDFGPSNSVNSPAIELEDIQVQNLEQVESSKYLNNNNNVENKAEALATSANLGNISLAFSR